MSRTVTLENEEFPLIRAEGGFTAGLIDMKATIAFYDYEDAPDWMVTAIEVLAYRGVKTAGFFELQNDEHLFGAIRDAIETHESEAVAELIADALKDDPDYLRDMRENSTLNHFQQFGSAA